MGLFNKLPNGYSKQVIEDKAIILRIADNFNKSNVTPIQGADWLRSIREANGNAVYKNIRLTKTQSEEIIHFDFNIVRANIIFNRDKHKFKVGKTCVVFIKEKHQTITDYKW